MRAGCYAVTRSPQQGLSLQQRRQSTRGHACCARSRAEETKFFQRRSCQPCCRIVGDTFHSRANIHERLPQTGGRARLQPCRKGSVEEWALARVADSALSVAKAIAGAAYFAGLKPGASTASIGQAPPFC